MREYETVYLLRSGLSEKEVQEIQERLDRAAQKSKGKVLSHQHLGKKPLSFPILREKEAIYLQVHYSGNGQMVGEMEQVLRFNEKVLRFLTTFLKEERV